MDNWPPPISSDGSSNRNSPERRPRPLYSRDSTQEHHKTLGCYQLKPIKTEVKEETEEPYVMGEDPCKEKEIPPEISTDTKETRRKAKTEEDEEDVNTKEKAILEIGIDGRYRLQNTEKYPTTSSDGNIAGDDITVCVTEENPIMPNQQPVLMSEEKSFPCSECGKFFTRKHSLIVHQRLHTGEKPYLCLECGKCFYSRPQLHEHQKTHPEVPAFSCSKCLKRFRTSRILALHQSIHSR